MIKSLPPRRRSLIVMLLAAALSAVTACGTSDNSHPSPVASPPSATAAPASGNPDPVRFGYQPLWPFGNAADAAAWQQSYRAGGHDPWHLAADQVAQAFTRDYLGYRNVDKIVKVDDQGNESRVSVGYANPNGAAATAAVLHLVRFGSGQDAPWEVVGTEDTNLTLTTPAYGAAVSSPLPVGGKITGVDESLRVQVRRIDRPQPVGESSGISAGGTDSPWTTTVPLNSACPGTLTIAVATGGHVADVERFAVTGVHC